MVAQQAEAMALLCQQLQQHLQGLQRQPRPANWNTAENTLAVRQLDERLKSLRQALARQTGGVDRALAAMLPPQALPAYGKKSAFGGQGRGPSRTSHQA